MAIPAPTDSPVLIRLAHPNVGAQEEAEAVMLQMVVDGQGDLDGETLSFYGPGGSLTASYVLDERSLIAEAQRTILLATPEAAAQDGFPAPDFSLDTGAVLVPGGGALCIAGKYPADCVSWGTFPEAARLGLPDPQRSSAPAIAGEKGLGRRLDNGCPTWLDPGDDRGRGLEDFFDGVPPSPPGAYFPPPAPRNNAASVLEFPCALATEIGIAPPNPTNDSSPTFGLVEHPPEYGARFECRVGPPPLDLLPFLPCPRAATVGPFADGTYEIQARAVGYAGTDPSHDSRSFTIDTVPPETTITQVPPNPSPGFSATFAFVSSEPHSSFVCQFESGPLQTCASPKTLFGLADGPHVFRVWAIDNATNKDPTPATHVFWVDTTLGDLTPPETTLLSKPPNPSQRPTASFTYRASKPGSAFQCSLNGAPLAPCDPAGISYGRLANGAHTFAVRAIDRAGNVDLTPASYTWRVAAPLPKTRILRAPPGARRIKAKRTRVRFAFRSSPPAARYRCRLGKQRFRACRSPLRLRVAPGRHRFEVFAIDALGNREERPVRRIFRVVRPGRGLFG